MCDIIVNNKESYYFRERECKGKTKYKVTYKFTENHEKEGMKYVCERHKKQMEKEFFIIKIENV